MPSRGSAKVPYSLLRRRRAQTGTLAVTSPNVVYASVTCAWTIQPRDMPPTCSVALQFTYIDIASVRAIY